MGLMAWMILECLSEELVRYVGLSSLTVEMIADIEVKKKNLHFLRVALKRRKFLKRMKHQ